MTAFHSILNFLQKGFLERGSLCCHMALHQGKPGSCRKPHQPLPSTRSGAVPKSAWRNQAVRFWLPLNAGYSSGGLSILSLTVTAARFSTPAVLETHFSAAKELVNLEVHQFIPGYRMDCSLQLLIKGIAAGGFTRSGIQLQARINAIPRWIPSPGGPDNDAVSGLAHPDLDTADG